jgi:hypothetical protein
MSVEDISVSSISSGVAEINELFCPELFQVSSINNKDIDNFSFDTLAVSTLGISAGGSITLSNFGQSFASLGSAQLAFEWFYEASTTTTMFYDTNISSVRMMTNVNGVNTDSPASRLTVPELSTSVLYVSSINGAEFTSTTLNIQVAGVSSLVANSISSIGAELRTALVSTLQFNPSFSPKLDFNFDIGSLIGGLKSGLTNIGIGVGTGTALIGTGLIASAFSRPGSTSINSNVYEQYATPTQLQFSTLGEDTSTFVRFVSSSGLANTVPGVEIISSSIIPAGTLCLRSFGDPTNLVDPSTYTSSIQAFGQWTAVPLEVSTLVSTYSELYTSTFNTSTINGIPVSAFENVSTYTDLFTSTFNTSTINGLPISDYLVGDPAFWAEYPAVSTITFSTGVGAIIQSANPLTDDVGIRGAEIELVCNHVDAQNLLIVSSISTAIINGANANIFPGLLFDTPGLALQAPNIFLSSQSNFITGQTSMSTLGAVTVNSRIGSISSLTASTINGFEFPQPLVSTFETASISSLTASTINGLSFPLACASFFSRSTQQVATNTPLVLYHEFAGASVGGSITQSTTAIVIGEAGVYDIFTSIQFDKSGAGVDVADFWFRKNGVDIPDSASQIVVAGNNGETLGNVSIFETFAVGDKLEVVIASADTTISATFFQSTVTTPYTRPAVPSVITNVKRLGV